jgi:hypothetical protein
MGADCELEARLAPPSVWMPSALPSHPTLKQSLRCLRLDELSRRFRKQFSKTPS